MKNAPAPLCSCPEEIEQTARDLVTECSLFSKDRPAVFQNLPLPLIMLFHIHTVDVHRLTLRLLMSYIYIYIYIYIYMEHLFLMFLDDTQRRTTVGRTPLDE